MSEKRLGRQTPTNSVILPYTQSKGMEAVDIYNRSGRTAQAWQGLMLEDIMAVDSEGLWLHMKFGWSIPRRNGKSEILIIRAMYGVSHGERVLYTAHRTTTSHNAWEKVIERLSKAGFLEGTDFKTTKQFGLERIEWLDGSGAVINFRTRSSKGGLGEEIDAYTLASIIRNRKDYAPGTKVRLLSCSTGNTDETGDCFAQLLANELKVEVEAPTKTLWVKEDGTYTIGTFDFSEDGKMKIFYSRR